MVEPNPDAHIPAGNPPTRGGHGYMKRTRLMYPNSMEARRYRFEALQKLIKPKRDTQKLIKPKKKEESSE